MVTNTQRLVEPGRASDALDLSACLGAFVTSVDSDRVPAVSTGYSAEMPRKVDKLVGQECPYATGNQGGSYCSKPGNANCSLIN